MCFYKATEELQGTPHIFEGYWLYEKQGQAEDFETWHEGGEKADSSKITGHHLPNAYCSYDLVLKSLDFIIFTR